MNGKAILTATFGYLLALVIILAISFDIEQVKHHAETISRWCLNTGERYPIVPAFLGILTGLILGALLGHLWFPQRP